MSSLIMAFSSMSSIAFNSLRGGNTGAGDIVGFSERTGVLGRLGGTSAKTSNLSGLNVPVGLNV